MDDCSGDLPEHARVGLRLFNEGRYFEAHEELELAWKEERGKVRRLYQGILEAGVTYLHITRGNYAGAVKVYGRSMRWLREWPELCRGVNVGQLRRDMDAAIAEVHRLSREQGGAEFDRSLLKPVMWEEASEATAGKRSYICDRCGTPMIEKNCKITCPNCGNRFDCSDLNIYFD